MRLTRRGYGVVAIVVFAELSALAFGARALNAIAAPAVIALLGAALQLRITDPPSATRSRVPAGFPGDTREVTIEVTGGGVADVSQPLPDGLAADRAETEMSLPGTFTFALEYGERGVYRMGPVSVTVRDLLGLVEESHATGGNAEVTVYPPVYQLAGQEAFFNHVVDSREVERQEFDTLREYTPGDPLRDVHWKSSAKDPDTLYVKEFVDRRVEADVVVAASGEPGHGDALATATASVAVMAIDAGPGVEVHAGNRTVPMGRGPEHRTEVLEMLAELTAGQIPGGPPEDADITIHADDDGVEIALGSRVSSLEQLTVSRSNPLATREVSA